MKAYKIIFLLIVCLCLCNCGNNSQEEKHNHRQEEQQIEETSCNSIVPLLGLVCSVAGLTVAIVAFRKAKYHNERLNRHRQEIDELKNKTTSYSNGQVDNLQDLSKRIKTLENEMQELKSQSYDVPFEIKHPNNEKSVLTKGECGYFETAIEGANNTGYFKELLPSKTSNASFSAEVEGAKAVFEPIVPLETIVSYDSMKFAIKFSGADTTEAKSMHIIDKGIAENKNDKWTITKKASVNLIK